MNNNSHDEQLFDFLINEADHPFAGWDFSYITGTGRMVDAPLTWSYGSTILFSVRQAQSLLDMGTGGGELLSSLRPLPPHTCATEGYAPNIPIARQRLAPLGVTVYEVTDDLQLPFADNEFDLVINRHEAYSPQEVLRVLKPGSRFVTQQVGGDTYLDLARLLHAPEQTLYTHWKLDYAARELADAGFHILDQKEDTPITRFFDVGAIVYYLKAIPWHVEGFSVEKYYNQLKEVHETIQREGFVDVRYQRFLLVAHS